MASVFTKIIQGELPCHKLFEDELCLAILTLEPIQLGHSLVIPKVEVNHWFEVPEATLAHMQVRAARLAKALREVTGAPRVCTAVVGFEVPHYHLHVIPAWDPTDLSFSKARRRSEAEMAEIAQKIKDRL